MQSFLWRELLYEEVACKTEIEELGRKEGRKFWMSKGANMTTDAEVRLRGRTF